ncbi:hypothetical protein niasHT_022872 [Heterodera trifolii]
MPKCVFEERVVPLCARSLVIMWAPRGLEVVEFMHFCSMNGRRHSGAFIDTFGDESSSVRSPHRRRRQFRIICCNTQKMTKKKIGRSSSSHAFCPSSPAGGKRSEGTAGI